MWRVQVANLHSGARALLYPSRYQKLDKIIFRHLVCWNAVTAFAIRLLTLCVFLQRSENLYCENKSDKEFRERKQQNQIVIRIGQRTATVTLLIISAVFPYFRAIFPAKLLYVVEH